MLESVQSSEEVATGPIEFEHGVKKEKALRKNGVNEKDLLEVKINISSRETSKETKGERFPNP